MAAFDLDGTLTEGGSVFRWLRHVAGSARAYRAAMGLAIPLVVGAVRSGRYADEAKERLFHDLLVGRDLTSVTSASQTFALEHLRRHQRSTIVARLRWHLLAGHDVVIVSASPQLYVEIIAAALGSSGALGTRLAVDADGKLTGRYLGANCRGSEKLRRLDEWIASRQYPAEPDIYAYGNSRGDRRLLGGATYPYDVGKLGRIGALRHFARLERRRRRFLSTAD